MRSHNGTNFVGGDKEVSYDLSQWNVQQIHGFFLQRHIKWILNPPSGSQQEGVWERCIRTVTKVLNAVLKNKHSMTRGCQRLCGKLRRSSIAGREPNPLMTLRNAKHLHRIIYSSFDQVRAYLLVHSVRKTHTPGGDGDRFSISLKYSGVVRSASTCRSYRLDRSG